MKPSIEILVHISGPSRGPDDIRYRKEARELLNFEPVKRHEISFLEVEEEAFQQSNEWKIGMTSSEAEDVQVEEQLLGDVKNTVPGITQSDFVNPAPVTTASSPHDTVRKDDPVAPRVVKRPISHVLVERTPALPRRKTTSAPTTPAANGLSHRRTVSDSWKTPPSVIPDSQPTPSFRDRTRILSSPCFRRPVAPSFSPSPTRDDEPRHYKRQRTQGDLSGGRETVNDSSVNDRLVELSSGEPSQRPQPRLLRTIKILEIHPPRPHSSKDQCSSHLTPSLQTISEKLPMHKYFKPTIQARSPEKLERGHWLVSIYSWEPTLKVKFWRFLTQFIHEGRAGWGVWCSREVLCDMEHTDGNFESTDTPACAEIIRLYCWGEVMGEIWVLLFIASERKIQGVGARWIDAMQETVAQMD